MNELMRYNANRRREVEAIRDEHIATHQGRSRPRYVDYPLPRLKMRIAAALSERWQKGRIEPQIELIDREQFGGDLALKVPQLLGDGGPKPFIQMHLPWIVEVLQGQDFADAIAAVQTKGMYINITLTDRWFLASAQAVADLGINFGLSDAQADQTILVDYSSPNVAKVLHAGHIRSTIIGHVLCNLHEGCGALVWRVNHINDFGGFAFTLEGYRRFAQQFPPEMSENDRLLEIYRIRRTLERVVAEKKELDALDAEGRSVIERYFLDVKDRASLQAAFDDYVKASDARFAALEAGEKEEVELWAQMVEWSMEEFEKFYGALDIHVDFVIGESFYFQAGDQLVDRALAEGTAIRYTEAEAEKDLAEVDAMLARGEIAPPDAAQRKDAIHKDIGAFVAPLDVGERFVVRRADGLSIYATRDLGAIALRREIFDPTDMTYVVGQEQRVHFSRLFKSAYKVGIATPDDVRFEHVWFGFYVDARTGKKLSSRDSVANVHQLLTTSIEYFRDKSAERGVLTEQELDVTARQLAVGSLVFNDLKQDVKGAVEIDTAALDAAIAGFEKSGGAYVVYTACRARSILRKYGKPLPRVDSIWEGEIDPQEALLLLKIQQIPERVVSAAEQSNPTVLIRHLLDTASVYNSYYTRIQVITHGVVDPLRLLFTKAVEQSLTNALRLCHVQCPAKI